MSTAAILSDFNGFEWDGAPFISESTFHNIPSQFEQDPLFLNTLYQAPTHHLRLTSPIANTPLTRLSPNPPPSELHKKGNESSGITNDWIGNDKLHVQRQQGIQSMHSIAQVDSPQADISQAKVLPPKLTPALLKQSNSATSNEESPLDLERPATQVKMRSASHRPKKVRKKPALPSNVVQARKCHNNVEKQYRTRLKQKFERLLTVLQASKTKDDSAGDGELEAPDCGYSRGEVLDFARQRILTLEEENRHLSDQVQHLDKGFTTV